MYYATIPGKQKTIREDKNQTERTREREKDTFHE